MNDIYVNQDLALNNQQSLICHETKPSQTKPNQIYLSIYLSPFPLGQDMTQGHFKAEFNRFEFRIFLLLD